MQLDRQIEDFVKEVGSKSVEVYNEFSLQHELGLFLRKQLGSSGYNIQFERNVTHFGLQKSAFEKKEIDIAITSKEKDKDKPLSAIELKYPRNGQVPESMFSFCKDIAFLEQLVTADSGFQSAYFLAFAGSLFFSGNCDGIYGYFRGRKPITGKIPKPTGSKDKEISITGSYTAEWHPVFDNTQFCLIRVGALQ
ncbi:MAG: hypothetical protein FWF20_12435 [Betaproteobacteria bacterium]|nr:hypothetical protein [Betaproteobacteria bacterium]MCL2887554.1 hypothetical protein [Betaproteobacteria bacterium]